MSHPLKDPNSTHYKVNRDEVLQHARNAGDMFLECELEQVERMLPQECEMIDIMEVLFSPQELAIFAKVNYLKYSRNKNQNDSDAIKADRYKNYYWWLQE